MTDSTNTGRGAANSQNDQMPYFYGKLTDDTLAGIDTVSLAITY